MAALSGSRYTRPRGLVHTHVLLESSPRTLKERPPTNELYKRVLTIILEYTATGRPSAPLITFLQEVVPL